MKTLIFLLTTLSCCLSSAALLLIPAQGVSSTTYFDWCYRENYSCTTDTFVNDIKNTPAILFNKLMDEVNLHSPEFLEKFRNSIIHILNTEDLDLNQLEMLLALLKELNTSQPSLLLKMLENELVRAQSLVLSSTDYSKAEFVLIFKKPVSLQVVKQIKTKILKIPLYLISYSNIPVKSNTVDFNRVTKKPLITGSCGSFKLNFQLADEKWILLKPYSCNMKSTSKTASDDFNFTKEVRY